MIFLTVGSALPFDRLVRMVDEAVGGGIIKERVYAQIGDGTYVPQHLEYTRFLPQSEFEDVVASASGIISHAGIGTIVSALKRNIPLLVLPRSPDHGELVDDHQEKTAAAFASRGHLMVFHNEQELTASCNALADFRPTPRKPNSAGIAAAIGHFLGAAPEHAACR